MKHDLAFTFASGDFYEPLAAADSGTRYAPVALPDGWRGVDRDVWTVWSPADAESPEQGWKIHVSAALPNAQAVLDVVAAACADHGVPFKHLAGRNFFLWTHEKHAGRVQSGKFCALYPPDPRLADELLRRLERDLADVAGPFVLTDRRFGSSRCVSYRYGAFRGRHRLEADGASTPVMLAVDGSEIPDERRPEFRLPPGVIDPFAAVEPLSEDGPVSFHGYTFESVLQHSNAGGAYQARTADGTQVFVKEARAHNGYSGDGLNARTRLEREYLTLRAVHAVAPGLCPEPQDYFTHWEHAYLVCELVPGVPVHKWMVANTPVIRVAQPPAAFAAYYRRCMSILEQLERIVARLHELGYVFADISPGNVLVDADDRVRLIDFETAHRIGQRATGMGTTGYIPPEAADPAKRRSLDPTYHDEYGVAALAQLMIFPLHQIAERCPEVLDHLRAGLAELAPVPRRLWRAATRFRPRVRRRKLPSPAEVAEQPRTHLRRLRDQTADALQAMAEPDHPRRVYPSIPDGYRSNTRCVAYGTAGVLHALRLAGREIDRRVVVRLRDDSLAAQAETPPGLLFGTAGIAWVLADLGEQEAADRLLAAAAEHPLVFRSATLAGGATGVAMAELAAHRRDGDPRHLETASCLVERIPDGEALIDWLGRGDASGLAQGRPGIALALYYLGRLTGESGYLARGVRLLRDELRHAEAIDGDALGFQVSREDNRNMPYLHAGSAGYAHVLARYLSVWDDPELEELLDRCLRALTVRFTVFGGLFQGQAGLALVQGDIADLLGRPELAGYELDAGRALFQYAVPHPTGVRWAGGHGFRLSADLWSGSAGVLLALNRMATRQRDSLFTLDKHVERLARTGVVDKVYPAPMSGAGS